MNLQETYFHSLAFCMICSYAVYFVNIMRGRDTSLISWGLWLVADSISTYSTWFLAENKYEAGIMIITSFGLISIVGILLMKGYTKEPFEKFHRIILSLSLLILIGYMFIEDVDHEVSQIAINLVIFFGFLNTFREIKKGEKVPLLAWYFEIIAYLFHIGILIVNVSNAVLWFGPILNGIICPLIIIYLTKSYKKKWNVYRADVLTFCFFLYWNLLKYIYIYKKKLSSALLF